MKKTTDFWLRIAELFILSIGVIAASILAYQQLAFNRQLVDADYRPSLEVKEENNQIRIYNRGVNAVHLDTFKIEPSGKSFFSIDQRTVFPGSSIDFNMVKAVEPYLNYEESSRYLVYRIFFSIKTLSGNKFYDGIIPIVITYGNNAAFDVKVLANNKQVSVFELPINSFADLYGSQK